MSVATYRPSRELCLRETVLDDYPQIAALECRYGLPSRTFEEWSHVWTQNPAYSEVAGRWKLGWVLEGESGGIVASILNVPLAYECFGRRLLVASGRSWVAEPKYRGLSLQLLDRVMNQPGIDAYINTTVSAASLDSVQLFGCLPVPVGAWDQSAFWVTDHRAFLESILVHRHGAFFRPFTYPLSLGLRLQDWLRKSIVRAPRCEIEDCRCFDDRFDEFWEKLRDQYPRVFLAVRAREALAWHFHFPLRARHAWIAAVLRGRSIQAYAIFDRNDNRKLRMRRVRLADYQSLDGDVWLASLLGWALRRCRREKIHVLECAGRWLEPGGFVREAAPYRRKLGAWTYFYRAHDPDLAAHLKNPAAWAPTLYDGDSSF